MLGYRYRPDRHWWHQLYMGTGRQSFCINRNYCYCITDQQYYVYRNRIERYVQQYSYENCNSKCIANRNSKHGSNNMQRHQYYFIGRWRLNLQLDTGYRIICIYRRFGIGQPDNYHNLYSNRFKRYL